MLLVSTPAGALPLDVDVAPPVLVSSLVSPTSVDISAGSGSVTVSVTVADASGVKAPVILLDSDATSQTLGFGTMSLVSGTTASGTWQSTIQIPQGSPAGTWTPVLYPLTDSLGNSGSFRDLTTVTVTGPLETFAIGTPALSPGAPKVGDLIQVDPGTWSPAPASFAYSWFRDDAVIGGAVAADYQVDAKDLGTHISVSVTATRVGYHPATSVTAATAAVTAGTLASSPTPTVSDTTPVVGQTLTADPGVWGPAPVGLSYQWLRGSTLIPSATSASYTVAEADAGATLTVQVTGTKPGYTTVTKTSTATAVVALAVLSPTSVPTISDVTPVVGQVLTASSGVWGPAPVGLSYQWLRGSTLIPSATSASYTVQAADAGATLTVQVTGSKVGYTTVTKTSSATARVAVGVLSVVPRVSDTTPVVEQTVTAEPGLTTPNGVAWRYQWHRKSSSGKTYRISSATQQTYAVKASDRGFKLQVKVTGSLAGYASVTKTTAWTSKVAKATFTTAPLPAISGVSRVSMKLTANPGSWSPTATLKYQWYRVSSTGSSTAIKGATKSSYTPTSADKGRRLKVRVQGSRAGYVTATRYSTLTSPVLPGMVAVTPKVSDNTPVVDQELTALEGIWTPSDVTFTYQWYAKSRSGKTYTISGATAKTYLVIAKYAGYKIQVKVTATKPDYASVSKTSPYTYAVKTA
ncbi:hypothetical protein [Propionicimonas sp.]|uniref:hypothetical protein n=1 Tax=Propionicimonas sp. TaxID=1955623 RepID=UPI002F40205B